jgi:hypothetical protein
MCMMNRRVHLYALDRSKKQGSSAEVLQEQWQQGQGVELCGMQQKISNELVSLS